VFLLLVVKAVKEVNSSETVWIKKIHDGERKIARLREWLMLPNATTSICH